MSARNHYVEAAVDAALAAIDRFIGGGKLQQLPPSAIRVIADAQLAKPASTRVASLFFAFYAVKHPEWDADSLPTGLRGKWGDKRLANELSRRDLTLHNAITAFGENLGWKGNVSAVRLSNHRNFREFSTSLRSMDAEQKQALADYFAARFAESRRVIAPLPPVGSDVLTYARAQVLFSRLISEPSEGNIQQFIVASILMVHRARYGIEVRTHHVHAADKYDTTSGDIEEFRDGDLVRAIEVTARPDWKNRVSDFKAKMDAFGLSKYTIIATDIREDVELSSPKSLLDFVEPYGRDIAVVDLRDFIAVFLSELSADELRGSINRCYELLREPKLCGRPEIIDRYAKIVTEWLDQP